MAHDSIRERLGEPSARASALRRALGSQRRASQARQLATLGVLALGALAMVVPFAWMLSTSLSRSANIAMPRIPRLWPPDPSLFNYQLAITSLPLARYYLNSLIVTASATLGYMLFSALAGYAFAKGRFPGKSALFILLLTTLMIPFEIRMLPLYRLMRALGLNNTMPAMILPFVAGGFGTFLMRQYITTIPDDLIDAARVDGANELTIFWRVVLPLIGPALAALGVISALWRWNDVLWPLLVVSDRNLYTVTLGLAIAARSQSIQTGVALASAALAILPIIALYVLLQRYIIRGVVSSGLKG
jgi:ABC-type glycerol-3-phosphate transport system permease component